MGGGKLLLMMRVARGGAKVCRVRHRGQTAAREGVAPWGARRNVALWRYVVPDISSSEIGRASAAAITSTTSVHTPSTPSPRSRITSATELTVHASDASAGAMHSLDQLGVDHLPRLPVVTRLRADERASGSRR